MGSRFSNGFQSANPLVHRLSNVVALTAFERDFLRSLRQRARSHSNGAEIAAVGEPLGQPMLIVAGWAVRQRLLANGSCQILSVLLPGEIIEGNRSIRPIDRESIVAVSDVRLVNAAPILSAAEQNIAAFARLSQGLVAERYQEESRLLASLVRIGCQPALERTAAFLLELYHRCKLIGFVNDMTFPMPLTQEMLGHALGISSVHVNRVISQLKKSCCIEIIGGAAKILDMPAILQLASIEHDVDADMPLHRATDRNMVAIAAPPPLAQRH